MKWETRKIKADSKLALEKRKHEVYCPKCKWTNHIYYFQGDRIVCKNCGTYIYKNKESEFKYKMKEVMNKCKYSN